jgi:hypothetical protein
MFAEVQAETRARARAARSRRVAFMVIPWVTREPGCEGEIPYADIKIYPSRRFAHT